MQAAEEKLATWYEVVTDNVAPQFSQVMMRARANYHKRLAKKYKRLAEAEAEAEEEGEGNDDLGLTF